MTLCRRCGIGRHLPGRPCDWCAAPSRPRLPFWSATRHQIRRSRWAAGLRRRGPLVTGIVVGVVVHLIAAAFGVLFELPSLWQTGFLWFAQWWWVLLPESVQPWAFAFVRGAAYGALAGWVAAMGSDLGRQTTGRSRDAAGPSSGTPQSAAAKRLDDSPPVTSSFHRPILPTPATVTALAAFLVSGCDPFGGTQHRLIAAGLGAAVGQATMLVQGSCRRSDRQSELHSDGQPRRRAGHR